MQNFYVFLDFDGVMWDFKQIKNNGTKSLIKTVIKSNASTECLQALQYLIENLKKDYNPIIVISSERRRNLLKLNINHAFGNIDCEFDKTDIIKFKSRRFLIEKYLKEKNETENFVIIDDFISSLKYFGNDKIIKTSMFKGGLSVEKVDKFLNMKEIIQF